MKAAIKVEIEFREMWIENCRAQGAEVPEWVTEDLNELYKRLAEAEQA